MYQYIALPIYSSRARSEKKYKDDRFRKHSNLLSDDLEAGIEEAAINTNLYSVINIYKIEKVILNGLKRK